MKRSSLLLMFIAFLAFSAQSCKNDKEVKDNAKKEMAEVKKTTKKNPRDLINKKSEEPVGPATTVKFKNTEYNFGKVMEGKIIEYDFEFTNTGKEPLTLKNVKASCGCTTPSWPRTPIAPSEKGKIHARFDTKRRGRVGGKPENKRITVTGNIQGGKQILTLKGTIDRTPEAQKEEDARRAKRKAEAEARKAKQAAAAKKTK